MFMKKILLTIMAVAFLFIVAADAQAYCMPAGCPTYVDMRPTFNHGTAFFAQPKFNVREGGYFGQSSLNIVGLRYGNSYMPSPSANRISNAYYGTPRTGGYFGQQITNLRYGSTYLSSPRHFN
jgi:hypothetical protein